MTIGTTTGDDMTGRQPVLLSPADQPADSQGWLYEQGGELKLDTQPSWDSWAICSGADHPELFWVAVVQGVVRVPSGCSLVRLFIIQFAQLSSGVAQGNC